MSVMTAAIERIGFHVFPLVLGRGLEGLRRIRPARRLRVDVARHVEGVRNVGHQRRIPLAAVPRLIRERRALEAVDHIMMHAGMVGSVLHQVAEDRHRLHAFRSARLVIGEREALHDHQGQIGAGFHLFRIFRNDRAEAA